MDTNHNHVANQFAPRSDRHARWVTFLVFVVLLFAGHVLIGTDNATRFTATVADTDAIAVADE